MRGFLAIIFAAAHRLLFLTGVLNFAFLMLWWTAALINLYILPFGMVSGAVPATFLHAPVMLYLMLPAFFFGFLLTVFPRWSGFADLQRRQYAPIGSAFFLATIIAWGALIGDNALWLVAALAIAGLGWLIALWHLAVILAAETRSDKGPTWHAWSAFTALCLGLSGLCFSAYFLLTLDGRAYLLANSIGTFGFMLPVFLTVVHRMIPFFAGNVVAGYVRWRPYWVLALVWVFLIPLMLAPIIDSAQLQFIGALALCMLTAIMLWRWWPRGDAPGLLMVLIWGFAWAPVGFGLIALGHYAGLSGFDFSPGKAPVHAIYIGMAGSLIIAMVTRVTQGHSGRPLTMNRAAWIAFWGIELSALARIVAGLRGEHGHWLVLAGIIWILLVTPWALKQARIYLARRADGKPG
ncbi:NnrS family protein [Parasphingorhabdus sp.]|uniref:NnrS family protein n=1 Tax=Parasphingorhabdus sp. TaxID=2709688 RepID=UPI002F934FC4